MYNNERILALYVEDNRDACEMLKILLASSSIDLICVNNSHEALALARCQNFDLYLLDTHLPDENGLDLCRKLRKFSPNVPVVFYSGRAFSAEVALGVAAGANSYLTKPNSDRLAPVIHRLVMESRLRNSTFLAAAA